MKRSEINRYQKDAARFMKEHHFQLPAWAYWTCEEYHRKTGNDYDEIKECNLGWDITDFGSGEFEKNRVSAFYNQERQTKQREIQETLCGKDNDCQCRSGYADVFSLE